MTVYSSAQNQMRIVRRTIQGNQVRLELECGHTIIRGGNQNGGFQTLKKAMNQFGTKCYVCLGD